MRLLFVGDIVGASGRAVVKRYLPELIVNQQIDFVIANGENAAHGKGITPKIANELLSVGIEMITLGNHAYSKKDVLEIDSSIPLVFPANMEGARRSLSTRVVEVKGLRLAISNILTQVFMDYVDENPFDVMEDILEEVDADLHFVDLHGEATSEKIAFAYYFKDHLIAVCGTHTHVQTADERIIDGCAFITDVGMSGPFDSVIGRDVQEVLDRLVHNKHTRYTVADTDSMLCAVIIEIDEISKRSTNIKRIQIRP